jgi:hypothetical protein
VEKKMPFLRKLLSLGGCARLSENKEVIEKNETSDMISDDGSLFEENSCSDQLRDSSTAQALGATSYFVTLFVLIICNWVNQSTKINLIGCDTIVNSPSFYYTLSFGDDVICVQNWMGMVSF